MATTLLLIGIVIFVFGAAVGGIVIVSLGIQHEERDFSLTGDAPGQVSLGTRRVTGLYVRQRSEPRPEMNKRPNIYA